MNNQKKIGIAILTALVIGVAGYFGYQHFSPPPVKEEVKTQTAAVEKFGVLEVMRAVKAHPQYAQIEALDREMEELRLDVRAKIGRSTMMSMPQGFRMEISKQMTAGEQALRTEANQKLAVKETEISKRLAETELAKRQAVNEEMNTYRSQIIDEYKIKMVNLQIKLETLKMSDELRASMEKELAELQEERGVKIAEKYESVMQKFSEEMQLEQDAAQKEMQEYIRQTGEEYGLTPATKTGQPNDEMMAELGEMTRQLESEVKASEKAYAEKRKKKEELESMIVRDIKMKAARIAREQEFTVVFSDVRVNLAAVDITDKVIEACQEHWKQ